MSGKTDAASTGNREWLKVLAAILVSIIVVVLVEGGVGVKRHTYTQ